MIAHVIIRCESVAELSQCLSYLWNLGYYDARSFTKNWPHFLCIYIHPGGNAITTRADRADIIAGHPRAISAPVYTFNHFLTSHRNVRTDGSSMVHHFARVAPRVKE